MKISCWFPRTLLNKADTELRQGRFSMPSIQQPWEAAEEKPFQSIRLTQSPSILQSWTIRLFQTISPITRKQCRIWTRSALILERPFTVRIPTSGQHLDVGSYPGYGDRDYAKYYRIKQVRFPFDVYSADRTQFYPENTWIDIPGTGTRYDLLSAGMGGWRRLPGGVPEYRWKCPIAF